jgi:DNA-directed RNA polymerase subunit RPC12/RpoP
LTNKAKYYKFYHTIMRIRCGNPACGSEFNVGNNTIEQVGNQVACPKCGAQNRVPKPPPKGGHGISDAPNPIAQTNQVEYGWIVVHDEMMPQRVYPLRNGKNVIGRNCDTTPTEVTLRIDTEDKYMSRKHCIIEVIEEKNRVDYVLSDSMSINGTYRNGKTERLLTNDEIYLKDSDCIQIGRTKVILKTAKAAGNQKNAQESVTEMDYTKTVIH